MDITAVERNPMRKKWFLPEPCGFYQDIPEGTPTVEAYVMVTSKLRASPQFIRNRNENLI